MKMTFLRHFASLSILIANVTALNAGKVTITLDDKGRNAEAVPVLKQGDTLELVLADQYRLTYEFSKDPGKGRIVTCKTALTYAGKAITIPSGTENQFLYFNLFGPANPDAAKADQTKLKTSQDQYAALTKQRKDTQDTIAAKNDEISQAQEEIKAYAGVSLPDAIQAIKDRQDAIRQLRAAVKTLQATIDASSVEDLAKQIKALEASIALEMQEKPVRAGVLPIGIHKKVVYYALEKSNDASNPYLLKHFEDFPIFTTDDLPYIVILGQHNGKGPLGLSATFTSASGSYMDVSPVRPVVTQPSVASAQPGIQPAAEIGALVRVVATPPPCASDLGDALVDQLLTFTDRLAGETIYSVTVTGYGLATTTDILTVNTGDTPSTQGQTITTKADLKVLNAEAWPQVHSLYWYNIATGVIWTSLRSPSFSRVATGEYLQGCNPSTNTSGTACTPLYTTVKDSGGPRILPPLMFTIYPWKRDTQVPVKWSELIPAPTIGLSLLSPSDDFFLGGSSELKPFRNVQLVYGLHLGRIPKLGANSVQLPTDNTAPATTMTLQKGAYIGLTFNIDFIKAIFGK